MKKRAWTTLLTLALALLLVACAAPTAQPPSASAPAAQQPSATQQPPAAQQPPADEKILIGVSLGNMGDVFDRILYDGMMAFQEENKDTIELQILNAQADTNVQLTNVDQLLNSQIDVLLLWPFDVDALTPAVEKANEKNVPVVCVNTKTNGGEFVYVGSDDVSAGRMQGEWLAATLPQDATYCYFMGPIGHSGQIGRKKGLEEVLAEKRPDIQMLAEQTGMWQRDKALDIANDWLKAFPDVTAFVSQNDNMALGIIEALRTSNKLGEVVVVGTDATSEACESIKQGELSMSVFQNARDQGYRAVETALLMAKGEWSGGDLEIPFESVDSTNVDQFIAMYAAAN